MEKSDPLFPGWQGISCLVKISVVLGVDLERPRPLLIRSLKIDPLLRVDKGTNVGLVAW